MCRGRSEKKLMKMKRNPQNSYKLLILFPKVTKVLFSLGRQAVPEILT
jgi:hypothetical protein